MHHASHLFGQKTTLPPSHVHIQRFSLPLPGRAGEKGQQFKEAIFPFSPMHHQFQTTPKKKNPPCPLKKKMDSKRCLVFLLMALTLAISMVAAEASEIHDIHFPVIISNKGANDLTEDENEFLLSSMESHRYISYESLKANQVPCGRRGNSYYGCQQRGRANPYRRGCSAVTHCARNTN